MPIPICGALHEGRLRARRVGYRPQQIAALILFFSGFATNFPADAQQSTPDAHAAQMIEQSRDYFGTRVAFQSCDTPSSPDEIVVCGRRQADPRFEQIEPPKKSDMKTVALGAPPVGGGAGVGVSVTGCFLQKCPKKLYFIDLKALPEPPPGSDADLIARGEAPAR